MGAFFHRLRSDFIRGLLVLLPIVITVYLIWLISRFFVRLAEASFGGVLARLLGSHWWVPALSLLLALFLIWLVGVLTRNYVGRTVHCYFENLLERIPLINKAYITVRRVIDAIFRTDLVAFKRVVLIEYPRKGVYTLGFVTNEELGRLNDELNETTNSKDKYISVYAPTSPNPLSGWFVLVPKAEVIYLPISVEEGWKLVLSAGVVAPEEEGETGLSLAEVGEERPFRFRRPRKAGATLAEADPDQDQESEGKGKRKG